MANEHFDGITQQTNPTATTVNNDQEHLVQTNFFTTFAEQMAAQMTNNYNYINDSINSINNSASSTLTMCSQMLTDTCDLLGRNAPRIAAGLCFASTVVVIVVPCVLLLNQPCKTAYICNKTKSSIYYESGRVLKPDECYYADLPTEGQPTKEQPFEWGSWFPVEGTQKLRSDSKENEGKQLVVITECDNPKVEDKGFCKFNIYDLYDSQSNSNTKSANSRSLFSFFSVNEAQKENDHPYLRGSYTMNG